MNTYKEKLHDKDILALYDYLLEYETYIKERINQFNIYDETVVQFRKDNRIYFGSIKNNEDKTKAQKFENHLLWAEGAVRKKNANIDRAHALLRRIRNAFAHGMITNKNNTYFELRDYDKKKGSMTLQGCISCKLLYNLIRVLKNTDNNIK